MGRERKGVQLTPDLHGWLGALRQSDYEPYWAAVGRLRELLRDVSAVAKSWADMAQKGELRQADHAELANALWGLAVRCKEAADPPKLAARKARRSSR